MYAPYRQQQQLAYRLSQLNGLSSVPPQLLAGFNVWVPGVLQ